MIKLKNKYISSGVWLLAEKIIKILTTLIATSLIAKNISVHDFGIYSFYTAIFSITTIFVAFGSDQLIIKDTAQSVKNTLESFFVIRLLSALFVSISLIAISKFFELNEKYIAVICMASLFQSFMVISPFHQGLVSYKVVSFITSVSLLLSLILKVYMIKYYDSKYLNIVMIMDFLIITILFCFMFFRRVKICLFLDVFKNNVYFNTKRSFPLLISALGIVIYSRVDQFMIFKLLGSEQLAFYSSVVRIGDAFSFIPAVIINAFIPFYEKNKSSSPKLILNFFKSIVIYGVLIVLFLNLFSDIIIELLYGSNYRESLNILPIYSLSLFFSYIGAASNIWLISNGLQKYKVYRIFGGCIVNVVLNLIWIPKYGVIGATYATLISQLLASWVFNILSIKTKPLFFLQLKAFEVYKWKN